MTLQELILMVSIDTVGQRRLSGNKCDTSPYGRKWCDIFSTLDSEV
jgi:hypothetical protein